MVVVVVEGERERERARECGGGGTGRGCHKTHVIRIVGAAAEATLLDLLDRLRDLLHHLPGAGECHRAQEACHFY